VPRYETDRSLCWRRNTRVINPDPLNDPFSPSREIGKIAASLAARGYLSTLFSRLRRGYHDIAGLLGDVPWRRRALEANSTHVQTSADFLYPPDSERWIFGSEREAISPVCVRPRNSRAREPSSCSSPFVQNVRGSPGPKLRISNRVSVKQAPKGRAPRRKF